MSTTRLPESLDAWRAGKATERDVEASLAAVLAAHPGLTNEARAVIETYRQGGQVPEAFARRLLSLGPPANSAFPTPEREAGSDPAAPGLTVMRKAPPAGAPLGDRKTTATLLRKGQGASVPGATRPEPTAGAAGAPGPPVRPPPTGARVPAPAPAPPRVESMSRAAVPPARPPTVGTVLAGQYAIESVIAGGTSDGLGIVYKARDLMLAEAQDRNPYVAIKVLGEQYCHQSGARRALQRVFNAAQQLSHPNIVKVQTYSVDATSAFLVMELLDGRLLGDERGGTGGEARSPREALAIIRSLTRALSYAHQLRIMHADFNPSNVFVTHDGGIKVLNFGLARALGARDVPLGSGPTPDPAPGSVSPRYGSCEQLLGEEPDLRDDVYSLGVVSYELLTGRHPWNGRDALDARGASMKPAPVPGLTHRQWATLHEALSFTRDRRPRDAQAFGEGLAPKRLPINLFVVGGIGLVLAAIAATMLISNVLERRRIESIGTELASPDPAQNADAVQRLLDTDQATVAAVLSEKGAPNAVLMVFERRARRHFDPAQQLYDLTGAKRELGVARQLLKDSASLRQFEESLEAEQNAGVTR